MDDSLLVRVLDGMADLHEDRDALIDAEGVSIAVGGDRVTGHVLHHEVGPPLLGRAGVEHPGDVGVVHHRQGLPLGLEAGDDAPGVHPELQDLEGHLALHGGDLLGKIDRTASPLAEMVDQRVGPDLITKDLTDRIGGRIGRVAKGEAGVDQGRLLEKIPDL